MSKKRIVLFILVLAALVGTSVPMGAVRAFAPYMPQEVEGKISHINVLDEAPIVFEYEEFYFDMSSVDSGTLTATYEMYNPGSEAVEISCALPVKDGDSGISVMTDGKNVATQLRYAYCAEEYNPRQGSYYKDYVVPIIKDDFIKDSFFKPDLPVTKYTYKVTNYNAAYAIVTVKLKTDLSTRYIVQDDNSYDLIADTAYYFIDTRDTKELVFYVIGENVDHVFEYMIEGKQISGEVELVERQNLTFLDLTLLNRNESVTEVDWYNAIVTWFNEKGDICSIDECDVTSSLKQWLKYSVTIGGGKHVTNVVTMPMFPKYIYGDYYTKPAYEFYLDLESTQNLNINKMKYIISSPYNVFEAYDFEYDKNEDAYVYLTDTKNEYGYIHFTLSKASSLKTGWSSLQTFFLILLLLPLIPIIIVVIIVIFVIRAIVKEKRNKKATK